MKRNYLTIFFLFVITAAAWPTNYTRSDGFPLLFIHFHKSGGSNMCRLFMSSREHVIKGSNCNCNKLVLSNLVTVSSTNYESELRNQFKFSDVCGIEYPSRWPGQSVFDKFVSRFPGRVITMLRDPWRRFKSNYERDMYTCHLKRCGKALTMEEYYNLPAVNKYSGSLYGAVHKANYHVRFLNRLASSSRAMTENDLYVAKDILSKFYDVYFLEQDEAERNQRLSVLLEVPNAALPTVTNNVHNPNHPNYTAKRRILSENEEFQQRYIKDNSLDYELYYWAAKRFNVTLTTYISEK